MKDENYKKLVNSAKWRAVRKIVLAREPLCRRCRSMGYSTNATEVHHIIPIESAAGPDAMARLAYDYANLMPLCHTCHVEVHRSMGKGTASERAARVAERTSEMIRILNG